MYGISLASRGTEGRREKKKKRERRRAGGWCHGAPPHYAGNMVHACPFLKFAVKVLSGVSEFTPLS
jgi:hypothetical protein